MAQELFSDLIVSQPNNPFISMLKKEPIVFSDSTGEVSNKQTAINPFSTSNGSQSFAEPDTHVYTPGNLETWKELDTNQSALNDIKPAESLSAFAFQSEISNVQPSNTMTTNGHTSQSETDFDQIKSSPTFDDDFDPAILEKQPWFQAEHLQATHSEQDTANAFPGNIESAESLHSWSSETQEEAFPTPPAWLDVLTKFEWQPGDPISSPPIGLQELATSNENVASSQTQAETELASPKLWEEDLNTRSEAYGADEPAFFFTTEENNSEMEWPEWLKSLGAETMETQPEPAEASVDLEPEHSFEFQSWTEQLDQTFTEAEQEQMASLEHLDNDLLSQGFVPFQPGTLNTFAGETSLSSALAELGNFPADPVIPEPASAEVTSDTFEPAESSELSLDSTTQESATESTGSPLETPIKNPFAQEAVSQTSIPVHNSAEKAALETPLIPAYRADALLEDDLETTMKRPAIRLQSMQQSAAHPDTLSMLGKGHAGEHGRAQKENVGHKERLLRGYQFQLAGAYDDAMAEYRIIIRNAPDLLSEVISDVRALLKLSPRYSAGFRVLGDAYMRQGEYLQAMEAYNKALTIAKKAKSQSI